MDKQQSGKLVQYVSYAQALYYVITGMWPIAHIHSFMMLTGRKVDTWLVKTVGALVLVVGVVVGYAGHRREATTEAAMLSIGSAASLAAVDIVYVARKRILPIYLLDALAEAILIALWAIALRAQR